MATISIYDSADVEIDVYREKFSKEGLYGLVCPMLNINKKQHGSWKEGDDTYHPILFEIECEDDQARKIVDCFIEDLADSCVDEKHFIYHSDSRQIIALCKSYTEFDFFIEHSEWHTDKQIEALNSKMSLYSWSKTDEPELFKDKMLSAAIDIDRQPTGLEKKKYNKFVQNFRTDFDGTLETIIRIAKKAKKGRQIQLAKSLLKIVARKVPRREKLQWNTFLGIKTSLRNSDYHYSYFFNCRVYLGTEENDPNLEFELSPNRINLYVSYKGDKKFRIKGSEEGKSDLDKLFDRWSWQPLDWDFNGHGSLIVKGEYEYTGDFVNSAFHGFGELKFDGGESYKGIFESDQFIG